MSDSLTLTAERRAYRTIALIRAFETRVAELYRDGDIPGFVTRLARPGGGRGRRLRRAASPTTTSPPPTAATATARQGRRRRADDGRAVRPADRAAAAARAARCTWPTRRSASSAPTAIVGAGMPLAVGAGLASKLRKQGRVAVAFFGEGAVNQGRSTRR